MAVLRFEWDCLRWAFWRWEHHEAMTPLVVTSVTWLLMLLGAGGIAVALKTDVIWIALLIPFAVMTIFVAPYKLWQSERTRADVVEQKAKPCLVIKGLTRQHCGRSGSSWALTLCTTKALM